jgi:hypothetical protein
LDSFKAQGYKYFEIPPVASSRGFGAPSNKVFFEASVKSGMPLLLKGPNGRGCDIGYHDLIDKDGIIDKAMEEYKDEPAKKIEYFMRWHQQLEKYTKTTGKQSEFATSMEKMKQQVNFTYFQKKYKGTLEDIMEAGVEGVSGERWDNVDMIAAKYAYTQIVKNIQAGHLGGKRFNPKDEEGNNELIKREFERLRVFRRPIIEKEIDDNMNDLKSDKKNTEPAQKAMGNIQKAYDEAFKGLKGDLSAQGVDIEAKFPKHKREYNPNSRQDTSKRKGPKKPTNPTFNRYGGCER